MIFSNGNDSGERWMKREKRITDHEFRGVQQGSIDVADECKSNVGSNDVGDIPFVAFAQTQHCGGSGGKTAQGLYLRVDGAKDGLGYRSEGVKEAEQDSRALFVMMKHLHMHLHMPRVSPWLSRLSHLSHLSHLPTPPSPSRLQHLHLHLHPHHQPHAPRLMHAFTGSEPPTGAAAPEASATDTFRSRAIVAVAASILLAANIHWYLTTDRPEKPKPLEFDRFNRFALIDVIPVTHDTSLFRFRAAHHTPDAAKAQAAKRENRNVKEAIVPTTNEYVPAPNHIVIKDDSCQIGRSYTPITYARDHFDLLVKKYENGSMSSMIHDLKVGEGFIVARGPILSFPYKSNMADNVVMIAGGTGITPMYQLIKDILRNPAESSKISLVYGSKSENDVLLGTELQILAQMFPDRLKVNHIIQSSSHDGSKQTWQGISHRGTFITDKVLKECAIPSPEQNPLILVCGPDQMVESIAGEKRSENNQGPLKGVLANMGYNAQQVFKF
ncbi:NADH-cytochrome b5 reductase [Entophlyctis sp. JEL0112]|nr:NADH-cytochrome b5 reductase [Entophlyctis sp. JEL0112]